MCYTDLVKLIITEKPSVARDIVRVLKASTKKEGLIEGNGMVITWALGHLIEFSQPDEYGPQYEKVGIISFADYAQSIQNQAN